MSKLEARSLRLAVLVGGLLLAPGVWAAHVNPRPLNPPKSKSAKVTESQRTRRRIHHLASSHSTAVHRAPAHHAAAHSTGSHSTGSHTTGSHTTTVTRASVNRSPHRY